jgi:hypothetical protein
MREFIKGHIIRYDSQLSRWAIYIDNKLASTEKIRSDKKLDFWRKFLKKTKKFDAYCLLPNEKPWKEHKTFEEIYKPCKTQRLSL